MSMHFSPQRLFLLLLSLAMVQFTHILDFVIIMPLGPQLIRTFGISPSLFGVVVSAYTFAASITGIIAAFFIDHFDRKKVLLTSYAGFALGTILCGLAPSYTWLVLARIVTGAFGGITASTILSVIGDVVPENKRGTAMGIVMSSFSIASIVGIPAGLALAQHLGWHAPFLALGALCVFGLGLILFGIPPVRGHLAAVRTESRIAEIKTILTHPNHLNAFVLSVCLMFSGFTITPYISQYLVSNVGLSESNLPYTFLSGGLFTLVTTILIGRLSDKMGKFPVFVGMVGVSILPIFLLTHLGRVGLTSSLVVSTLYMISMSGRMIPAMALLTSSASPQHRGGFMSLNSAIQQMALGASSFIGGLIITKTASGQLAHYDLAGYVAICSALISVPLARRLKPGHAPLAEKNDLNYTEAS